ncbi:MAG: leucine--tRNA ligase [Buchnera aphidicola (Nurudea yanoniella)]
MKKEYIPKKIEREIQKIWEKNNTFSVIEDTKKEKYYCLAMIPYPSGKLHMGHVRNYTISDVVARYQRMIGKNVLHPIGWDAFGLPAEIAAMQNNIAPSEWTNKNIKYMKKQLKSLGFSYDWDREITTCKPEYYKWEQWFFIELYKKKLVYKKKSLVNWCEFDQTVLANEQVIEGLCWRCNTKITKKNIPQWFIKITKYAKELLQGLKTLSEWPEKVKKMQSNWIGRMSGIEFCIKVLNMNKTLTIFTEKPEILIFATYIAISPLHKLAKEISYSNKNVKLFIKQSYCQNIFENNFDKNKGIDTKIFALHPLTQEKIPIWIANYVLSETVTQSVLGVPHYNLNDCEFSLIHKIKTKPEIFQNNQVIQHIKPQYSSIESEKFYHYKENNEINIKKTRFSIISKLKKSNIVKRKTYYKLKDWGVSRQRYWGVPIPMATLKNNDIIPIPDINLPINLHKNTKIICSNNKFTNSSYKRSIYINGKLAIYENDTLDTFVESSWYYARYTCPKFNKGMIEKNSANYWLPVDLYVGGIEHSTMHLMYFRFFHKLLRDFGFVQSDEPVKKLLCQGMVLSDAFYYFDEQQRQIWINIPPIHLQYDCNKNIKKCFMYKGKKIFHEGMIKMSKSKKNGIEPEIMINKYGADTVRLFIMFAAPTESSLEWKESGVKGIYRFLKKLWTLCYNHIKSHFHAHKKLNYKTLTNIEKELYLFLYETIQKVTHDIDRKQSFNTAISEIMKLVNKISKIQKNINNIELIHLSLVSVIKIMYPFTPHFSHTLLQYLLNDTIKTENLTWPNIKKEKSINLDYTYILVQINGKFRHKLLLKNNLSKSQIFKKVMKEPKIFKYINHVKIHNVIYIPNKLINLVTHN